jgi:periplasmic copper chaperone A
MKPKIVVSLAAATVVCLPAFARAHISVASGPAFANVTQEISFGVGHGCTGADTYRVRVVIPAGVTSVRPLRSDFGKAGVEKDAAGAITAVVWQKADADALDSDLAYYKLTVRMKAPDQPFTSLYFRADQTCRATDGTLTTVEWKALPTDPVGDGGAEEPAAELKLVPARKPGWNKYTVAAAMTDLGAFFPDALIVWKGSAAFSANPATLELIAATPGVTALGSLAANDEIWVRY